VVIRRLNDAGAVLLAKLSLGALALNDIWFGGQTMNPWLLEEGASGSSAGPGAATAAGLVGFSIGSETGGSIVSPAMRCGVTGMRPTFGRVPRTGAMALCWSLDKLGPMTRTVEDAMLVLHAITGPDAGDVSSVASRLDFDANAGVDGLKVGYFPTWMKEAPATDVDRAAFDSIGKLRMTPVEVSLPDWPYGSLFHVLFSEAAAAFEELTLSGDAAKLKVQVPDAWPNLFRQARFLSAVDFVQADRLRRRVRLLRSHNCRSHNCRSLDAALLAKKAYSRRWLSLTRPRTWGNGVGGYSYTFFCLQNAGVSGWPRGKTGNGCISHDGRPLGGYS
jgi:Asp-tRNA(Asn)/Glu-tRNA(Gln) amidotransferase A subunit family amidase